MTLDQFFEAIVNETSGWHIIERALRDAANRCPIVAVLDARGLIPANEKIGRFWWIYVCPDIIARLGLEEDPARWLVDAADHRMGMLRPRLVKACAEANERAAREAREAALLQAQCEAVVAREEDEPCLA